MGAKRIGIAGFMGCGKSTCVRFVSEAVAPFSADVRLLDADKEAKRMMQADIGIKNSLVTAFGPTVVQGEAIVFSELGKAAFASAEALHTLNRIVHPVLIGRIKELLFSFNEAVLICDAALIPLWRIEEWFGTLVWIQASPGNRLERLAKKTALPRTEIGARMRLQESLFREPDGPPWQLLPNNGTVEELREKVLSCRALAIPG